MADSPRHTRQLRYEDLTAAEQAGMEQFVQLWTQGEQHDAIRANTLALDLEHLISTLPIDLAAVDADMKSEVEELRDQFLSLTGVKVLLHVLGDR